MQSSWIALSAALFASAPALAAEGNTQHQALADAVAADDANGATILAVGQTNAPITFVPRYPGQHELREVAALLRDALSAASGGAAWS